MSEASHIFVAMHHEAGTVWLNTKGFGWGRIAACSAYTLTRSAPRDEPVVVPCLASRVSRTHGGPSRLSVHCQSHFKMS